MKTVQLSDVTMKRAPQPGAEGLTFREKLELARLLDGLGVPSVEAPPVEDRRTDALLLKSLSGALSQASLVVTVPAGDPEAIDSLWACLKEAKKPRLQVSLPVSTVGMEYLCHKKPDAMLAFIAENVAACRAKCPSVEFCAEDAGRAEPEFLRAAFAAAVEAGASVITYCDSAGDRLPEELYKAVSAVREAFPDVKLGVRISNDVYMADAGAVYAVRAGADEIKVAVVGSELTSLKRFAAVLKARGEELGVTSDLRMTELNRTVGQIERLVKRSRPKTSPFEDGVRPSDEGFSLNASDDAAAIRRAAERLGYSLTEEDEKRVYAAFLQVADKKGSLSDKELDVLIATSAMQVPPTYTLESYVINSGNRITSTSHVRLRRGDEIEAGVCLGDGPIDASFLAIEQIVGTHYELDDFQIRSVTEGREAMGEAVVRLVSGGKLYAGRGISTDIVGASIQAYVNALNKILFEENDA